MSEEQPSQQANHANASPEKPTSLPPAPSQATEQGQQPSQHTTVEEIIYEESADTGGCRSCLYVTGGAGGCFVILVALIIGAIAVGGAAVEDAFDGLFNIVQGETRTRNITAPIVERIKNMQELQTTRYNFSNIIESSVDMPPLLAGLYGENIIMIAVAHIEAGIDLSQLTEEDVILQDGTLTLTLPAPEILSCFFDEQQTEVVERNRGIFAPADVTLDDSAREFALKQFINLALENGILTDAQEQSDTTIRQLIGLVLEPDSGLDIVIQFADPIANKPFPDTCPT